MIQDEANLVSVSGGKDSAATLMLAMERGVDNIEAVFADTGHEHPMTYEWLDYFESQTIPITRVKADFSERIAKRRVFIRDKWREKGVPEKRIEEALEALQPTGVPFLDLCLWKGLFPSTRRRFCSQKLKHEPLKELEAARLADFNEVISWQGIRADESRSRAEMPEREDGPEAGLVWYRPILAWSADDVFAMHRKHGIKPNPLYSLGMGRVGCMPCIHARKSEIQEIARRFPEEFDRLKRWEAMVSAASKRGVSTFFAADKTPGEGDTRSNVDAVIEWSKTTRGGKQYDLLIATDAPDTCSSLYGLCE